MKLSDELVLDARITAEVSERSIAGQIEFWARLGRAVEPLLKGTHVMALQRAGAARPLSQCIGTVDSEAGRQLVADYLEAQPFPHYAASTDHAGLLVRTEADGSQTPGRFVARVFTPHID